MTRRIVALLDRPPLNSPWVRSTIDRWALPFWFLLISGPWLILKEVQGPNLLIDARLYMAATREWLSGGDPWSVQVSGLYFAAPPPTLLPMAPFALLPDPAAAVLLGILCFAFAVWTLRLLDLPPWWLLFPPIVQSTLSGNVHLLLLPLILRGGAWLAPVVKVYAVVPIAILGRWRSVAVAALLLIVTVPILPWATYLAHFGQINATLEAQSQSGPSAQVAIVLLPIGLVCLWVIGRMAAAWMAVPALWPSQQWYYATFVLPTRSRLVAVIVATPFAASGFVALVALAAATIWRRRNARGG